jgi:hypothetical protein
MNDELSLDLARKIRHALKGLDHPDHFVISALINKFFLDKYVYIKNVSKVLDIDETLNLKDAAHILDIAESKELENDPIALLDIINQHKKGITL